MKPLRQTTSLVTALSLLSTLLSGCRVYDVIEREAPPVVIPEEYHHHQEGEQYIPCEWWREFQSPGLNQVVEIVLSQNLDLMQAWDRLAQARAQAFIVSSDKVPNIDLIADITRRDVSVSGSSSDTVAVTDSANTRYLLGTDLSYEIDLWQRIHSRSKAAWLEVEASCEDVHATALALTGAATTLWFDIQEQRELLDLFTFQIDANKTLLELVELRFGIGEASALDVYQQRLQLAQTEAQVPPVRSLLETSKNQLSILMGFPPNGLSLVEDAEMLGELPPFPAIGTPVDLLFSRPDIRSVQRRIMSADYEVAAAIADRFPKLLFLLSYDFSALDWKDIFDRQVAAITADLLTPLVDGGRRRSEVERRKAIVCELLHLFGQVFLIAMGEVEDAIVQEKYELELIEDLQHQLEVAELNLSEARSRYATGLTDYLPVITAITALQDVQNRMINARKRLMVARTTLYRALGGYCWTENCKCEE